MSALAIPAALRDYEIKKVEFSASKSIDVGVFGSSFEGTWMGAPCAVKKLQSSDAVDGYISDRFKYECRIWCDLKHPNIIQFFGIFVSPVDGNPMLVCELQHDNLARFLSQKSREMFPLHIKTSILKDVALAVRYLHSLDPVVLIRDLSASFIYLTPSLTAKIGDFGGASKVGSGKTGTLPPTGMMDWPEPYSSTASDSFSYGELIIHVLLHESPKPSPKVLDGKSDKAIVVKEFDRRREYISALSQEEKNFLPLIAQCLQDNPTDRPSFASIVEMVNTYLSVFETGERKDSKATKLLQFMSEMGSKEKELHTIKSELTRLRMSLRSIVNGPESLTSNNRHSVPLPLCPPIPLPRPNKSQSLLANNSKSRGAKVHQPLKIPAASIESLTDQGYESITPSARVSMISTQDTSEDDYIGMSKQSSPEAPQPLSPLSPSQRSNRTPPPVPSRAVITSSPPCESRLSVEEEENGYHVKSKLAVMRKDCDSLKMGDRVLVVSETSESCLVRVETTGQSGYVLPEYLAELKPIEKEIWFSQMHKVLLEEHMRKPYIPNGSFVVRRGNQGYVLVLKHNRKPHAYQIFERHDGTFSLNISGQHNFVTIRELVRAYTARPLGLVTQTTLPFISQRTEVDREAFVMDREVHQCRGGFTVWSGSFTDRNGIMNAAAVKTVSQSNYGGRLDLASLYQEMSILNYFNRLGPHPNVIRLFGICSWLSQPFMVTEYCPEGDLLQFVRKYSMTLRNEDLKSYCTQISSAMTFLEENSIVHRDLRAASVLIDGCQMCKLSSFHQSRTAASVADAIDSHLYLANANRRWLAPEVLSSIGATYLSKSDVWSFGVLMVEVFSRGCLPFEDIPDVDIVTRIIDGAAPQPPSKAPSEIQALMKSCFLPDHIKRPSFSKVHSQLSAMVA